MKGVPLPTFLQNSKNISIHKICCSFNFFLTQIMNKMVHFDISNNLIHMYAFFDAVNLFGDPPGIHVALVASINTLHLINREFSLEPLAGLFISELLQITNIKCFLIHVQTLTGCFTSCSFCRNVATGIVPMSLGCKMHNTGDEFICMCIILVVKKKRKKEKKKT